jgi:hypothetical protein
VAAALVLVAPAASAATDYSTAPFEVANHSYTFGQAPVFMPDGRVVVGKDFGKGDGAQVYISSFDGSRPRCLTCALPPPNNVPTVRPQGDWIIIHSWIGHHFTIGSPGYGGLGSELYAMRPDGTQVTKLTGLSAANGSGEGEDDYHAYWSPDGKRIVYGHLNWNFVNDNGQGNWDVRVADFVDDGHNPPYLTNTRIVRPANGHWYETQWWAPDGSGFLYTETWDTTLNPELFFCRLTASGCQVTRLTNNTAWDEQALFTPDMKDVIFMSTRDHPGAFNSFTALSQAAGLTTSEDNLLILPLFEAGFLQPVGQEATDLYDLHLATGAVRRLTIEGDDGWIIPEFAWDPTNKFLMWTEQRYASGVRTPLPPDPVRQLQDIAQLLQKPPVPGAPGTNVLAPLPLEARTRIARFPLSDSRLGSAGSPSVSPLASCSRTGRLRFRLRHRRGVRVVKVKVLVDGRRVLKRRGRSLRRVTIAAPRAKRFVVAIITTLSNGRTVTTTRRFSGCSRTRVRKRRHHRHRRPHRDRDRDAR